MEVKQLSTNQTLENLRLAFYRERQMAVVWKVPGNAVWDLAGLVAAHHGRYVHIQFSLEQQHLHLDVGQIETPGARSMRFNIFVMTKPTNHGT